MQLNKIKIKMNVVTWLQILLSSVKANGPLQLVLYLSNLDFGRFVEYSKTLEYVENEKNDFILDVGAGYSTFPSFIQGKLKANFQYVTLDLSLGACKYQAESKQVHKHQIRCDMTHLPIKPNSISSIIAISSVEHVPDYSAVFKDMGTSLNCNGVAILTLPSSPKGSPTFEIKHNKKILFLLKRYNFWTILLNKHLNYFIEQTATDSILKYYDSDLLSDLTEKSGLVIEEKYYFGNSSSYVFRYLPRGWFILKDFILGVLLSRIDENRIGTPKNSKAIVFKARKRNTKIT
jgi:ubiquinone/menaquinone biosynthesis C-methylase UbiE